ncbi:DB module [Trichuris trichiura]|uniref:DB module n=1 Tax=Trichuris trichiura TaxID=36087 RepID=A0A077ZFW9_TRITR|nr:DB module [Trichuris trichiura]
MLPTTQLLLRLLLAIFMITLRHTEALSCEKAGCQYCSYVKMQRHCASFCSMCSVCLMLVHVFYRSALKNDDKIRELAFGSKFQEGDSNRVSTYKVIPYTQPQQGREVQKYTRPYNRRPYVDKAVTRKPSSSITKPTKTAKTCDGLNPCVPLEQANSRFQQCCEARRMKNACVGYCRYDITKEEARFAFMHGKCPFRQLQTYLSCAAAGKDRRNCCRKKGVLDGALAFCEPFCAPDNPGFPGAKPRYQPCAEKLISLMNCYWAGLE